MRASPSVAIFSFILAAIFLSKASATPMKSDCLENSSQRRKSSKHSERVVGDGENSQEEGGTQQWITFFKDFWVNIYEEPCQNPVPSPSESPIPDGVGEYPEKVKSKDSDKGFNEGAYTEFVLNEEFYLDVEDEAPDEIYDENKAMLHYLMKRAERGSLGKDEAKTWEKVVKEILQSYKKEKGAIFYDIAFSQLWRFCGWVKMKKTFVVMSTDKYMRVCVSLISLGMDDITRTPAEGKDFIVPGESDPQKIEKLVEPVLAVAGRQSLNKTARPESVIVDLLNYPEYCDTPLDLDPNCYAFCCLTPYYGSEFCHDCGF